MKKTPESISRRNRLRKTKAKRKVMSSRSQYATKKVRSMSTKSKGLKRKTVVKKKVKVRKAASPMRMKKSKKIVLPEPNEIKIVAVEELEKPSCGCGM